MGVGRSACGVDEWMCVLGWAFHAALPLTCQGLVVCSCFVCRWERRQIRSQENRHSHGMHGMVRQRPFSQRLSPVLRLLVLVRSVDAALSLSLSLPPSPSLLLSIVACDEHISWKSRLTWGLGWPLANCQQLSFLPVLIPPQNA
jgi:hypothetical protein